MDQINKRALEDMTAAIKIRDRNNTIIGIITITIAAVVCASVIYFVIKRRKRMGR